MLGILTFIFVVIGIAETVKFFYRWKMNIRRIEIRIIDINMLVPEIEKRLAEAQRDDKEEDNEK